VRASGASATLTFTLATLGLGIGGDTPVPWPLGGSPSASEMAEALDGALALADRERFEELLEAYEKGEDGEHIFVRQDDIDLGLYDLARLFQFGDSLFSHEFRATEGYGDGRPIALARVHSGVRGGLDTYSCAGCHSVGGLDGAGGPTQNAFLAGDGDRASSANVRNAPAVLGLGLIQELGVEISKGLNLQRLNALDDAKTQGAPVTIDLAVKGVSFGRIVAYPDGALDLSGLEGVGDDLVVRPFGWKGNVARLRRFAEDAARVHFGVQSQVLALGYEAAPDPEHLGPGPNWWDPDGDGVVNELQEGSLTAVSVYMAMLEAPVVVPPHDDGLRARWAHGSAVFDEVGCAGCHVREMELSYSTWTEKPDTTEGDGVVVDLLHDGDPPKSTSRVKLFSDLKRHDLGDELADPHDNEDGIPRSVFLTRPLWGLAETPPYLHDGRAATIPQAIVAHGGEATESRDAFLALSDDDRADLHLFLLSLSRAPKIRVAR
jgi:mono/diheme cytochrome c family protein